MAKSRSLRRYLGGIRDYYRHQIWGLFRFVAEESPSIKKHGNGSWPTNKMTRLLLSAAIFQVENDLESRNGGQSEHPAVLEMNAARIRVEDDLWGDPWNGD